MNPLTLIQCATPPEFAALGTALDRREITRFGKRQSFEAGAHDCVVLRGAIGKVWAAASAEFGIARFAPGLLIDFGAAGALDERLRVGDLIIAESVVEHDVSSAFAPLPRVEASLSDVAGVPGLAAGNWLETVPAFPEFMTIEGGIRVTRGRLAAGDRDIRTVEERRALAEACGAIAVTWESSAVGRVARFHDVRFLSVRVVTDIGHGEFSSEFRQGMARALAPAARAVASLVALRPQAPS